jgi:hypothetical protein
MDTASNTTPATPTVEAAKKVDSIVDTVFDTVTTWAAQGLTVTKVGLEASARWLEARAKDAGELAKKLGQRTTETA